MLLAVVATATLMSGCSFSAPAYQGPRTDHFDGETFENPEPIVEHGFGALIKWQLTSNPAPWPRWIPSEPGPRPVERVEEGRLRVTWINHSTVLIQMDGLNILTDPIWSKRCSPVSWAGPKRRRVPGVEFEQLPPIDVVLISHNHYDHLDLPTLQRIHRRDRPRFIVPLGNTRLLRDHGIDTSGDLDWWQRVEVAEGVWISLVPAVHFSGRGLTDGDKTLWGGFVIEGDRGPVYFAGDTGFGEHFAQIREQFGPIELAILPIGAYEPRWFMSPVHIDPSEAVRAHEILDARRSFGIHWGTFRLADEGPVEPIDDLGRALSEHPKVGGDEFQVLEEGLPREF
jgi:L-ascorbate metabolism protein UlaG (beta-lactamase superfamily)